MSAQFTTVAPIEAFAPKSKGTGERKAAAELYRTQLENAITNGEALVVTYEDGGENPDNPLTVKNRLQAAANDLGIGTDVIISKVRNQPQYRAVHKDLMPE